MTNRVFIFKGVGDHGLVQVQRDANLFFETLDDGVEVVSVTTAVADFKMPRGRNQAYTLTVWMRQPVAAVEA